jgi:hypothetical protein
MRMLDVLINMLNHALEGRHEVLILAAANVNNNTVVTAVCSKRGLETVWLESRLELAHGVVVMIECICRGLLSVVRIVEERGS